MHATQRATLRRCKSALMGCCAPWVNMCAAVRRAIRRHRKCAMETELRATTARACAAAHSAIRQRLSNARAVEW